MAAHPATSGWRRDTITMFARTEGVSKWKMCTLGGGVGTNNKTVHIVLQANDGLGIQYPGPSLRVFVYYRLHCSTKSRASLFIAGEGRIAASVDVRGM